LPKQKSLRILGFCAEKNLIFFVAGGREIGYGSGRDDGTRQKIKTQAPPAGAVQAGRKAALRDGREGDDED